MPNRRRYPMTLLLLLCNIPLCAAENPRSFPLWDGRETTAEYAARVHLPRSRVLA
jgi:hypothetical protein